MIRTIGFATVEVSPKKMRQVVVLQHQKVGVTNNVIGLGGVISEHLGVPLRLRRIKLRTHWLLPLLRFLSGDFDPDRCRKMAWLFPLFFADRDGEGIPKDPACIVASQGNREVPCVFLSRLSGCRSVYLGQLARLPESKFDIIIDIEGSKLAAAKACRIPVVPSSIRLRNYADFPRKGCLAVIGGPIKGVDQAIAPWKGLIEGSSKIADATERQLSITTSPRTGAQGEAQVRSAIKELGVRPHRLVYYGAGDRTPMKELLSESDIVIVSADSATMISEAVASGARVVAAYFEKLSGSEKSIAFATAQAHARRILLWDVRSEPPTDFGQMQSMTTCWSDQLWRHVRNSFEPDRTA